MSLIKFDGIDMWQDLFVFISSLKSLFVNICFIFRNSLSSELILRYLLILPLLIWRELWLGSGMRIHRCIIGYWLVLCGFVRLGSDFCQIGDPYTGLYLGM